ncbi:MAG: response regulator [Candidatus Omnitrophica bacterium]|nr:response regulator [Candidatus Omnitrophota bacterium]
MPYHLLIVDDDREYRESFRDLFEDFHILEASNGQEALDIIRKPHDLDLVVLDEKMPGLTGTQILREIKRIDPDVRTIILTAQGSEETAAQALRGKAEDYLQKSLPFETIERRVRILAESIKKPEKTLKGGIRDKIDQMKYFAQKNYHKNIRLDDLAQRLFLSQKYLSKIFRQYTGITYNEYKIKVKIEKARELLKKKDFNIYRIAENMGYQNTESFIRIFERETGYTPTQYREQARKKNDTAERQNPFSRESTGKKKEGRTRLKTLPEKNAPGTIDRHMAFLGHEIRGPLATIRATTFRLKKKKIPADMAADVEKIERMVTETDRIVANMISFAGNADPRPEKTSVSGAIAEALRYLEGIIRSKNITVTQKQKKNKDVFLYTDRASLIHVLTNIIHNAATATKENKGRIVIETQDKGSGCVTIRVSDNGHGIEKKDLDRIFIPFVTAESKGTGLGLAVCRKLVQRLKGNISIASRSGKKTCVTLDFRPTAGRTP